MSPQPTSPNTAVGSVAAAATTGALIAMGRRAGNAGFPFAAVSSIVLHQTPSAGAMKLVLAGLVLHVALTFVWAGVFVWLQRNVTDRAWAAAVAVAIAQFGVAWLVARWTGAGLASVLPLGDRLSLALVMGVALVAGMRFARVAWRIA